VSAESSVANINRATQLANKISVLEFRDEDFSLGGERRIAYAGNTARIAASSPARCSTAQSRRLDKVTETPSIPTGPDVHLCSENCLDKRAQTCDTVFAFVVLVKPLNL